MAAHRRDIAIVIFRACRALQRFCCRIEQRVSKTFADGDGFKGIAWFEGANRYYFLTGAPIDRPRWRGHIEHRREGNFFNGAAFAGKSHLAYFIAAERGS